MPGGSDILLFLTADWLSVPLLNILLADTVSAVAIFVAVAEALRGRRIRVRDPVSRGALVIRRGRMSLVREGKREVLTLRERR